MKKIFALILTVISFGFVGSLTQSRANVATSAGNAQVNVQIPSQHPGRGWRNRAYRNRDYYNSYRRSFLRTRYVRYGWATFRETYQVTYLPNGRYETTLISRVRVS